MEKLSDNQIGDRLYAALEALGKDEGLTIRGRNALIAARQSLELLKDGRLIAEERGPDHVSTVMSQGPVMKPTKTIFELEAMILAEMMKLGGCPIGVTLSVKAVEGGWVAITPADDPICLGLINRIEAELRSQYDLAD